MLLSPAPARVRLRAACRAADRGLLRLGALLAVGAGAVGADVASSGRLRHLDHVVSGWQLAERWPAYRPLAEVAVLAGQRGPVAVVVAAVVIVLAFRRRRWWPVVLPVVAVAALNVVVGGLKVLTGRTAPEAGRDAFLAGGMEFPSGHAANSVLMWGALALVLAGTGVVRSRRLLVASVAGISIAVGGACVYLDTHWISDLVAGWMVGGALLATIAAALPAPGRPADVPAAAGGLEPEVSRRR